MGGSIVRVLLADDFLLWRRFVSSMLQHQPALRIVGEVSDGLHAAQKSEELQPDLILLDIGLPTLNGIEVARRARDRAPRSKILFVSENRSWDIVEEALQTGALGYLVKSDATSELMSAVDAVLRGKRFVSASLIARASGDRHLADQPKRHEVIPPLPPRNLAIRHEVAFYADDTQFVRGFARVAKAALRVESPVVLIATESHRARILERLLGDSVDLDAAIDKGRYVQLDAHDTLSKLMINNLPDPVRCANLVGDLIRQVSQRASGEPRRIAICGECAPSLLAEGNPEAAIRLEHLWDEVTRCHDADTLCGYGWGAFPSRETSAVFQRICAEHSAVHGRELAY
jgi:DNA-binding NarL/FixJ family response regulator